MQIPPVESVWSRRRAVSTVRESCLLREDVEESLAHRSSDIKAETIVQSFRDTKGGCWESEKEERKVLQAKETSCTKKCRLEGNERTVLLNHTSFQKRQGGSQEYKSWNKKT